MRKLPSHFVALACSCAFFAAAHAPLCAQVLTQPFQLPQDQPQHVQPGQLAQSTLPKPTKLVVRPPNVPPELDATSLADAAAKISALLANFKSQHVAVLDFAMPQDAEWNRVGQELADEFRDELATAAPGTAQLSRDDIAKCMKHYDLVQEYLPLDGVAARMLEHSGADSWVTAEIRLNGANTILLTLTAVASNVRGGAITVHVPLPVTPELDALLDPPAPNPLHDLEVSNLKAHAGMPACEYCPQSEYTDDAVKAKLQGTVYLAVTIDASGAAKQIYVLEGLPFGLTQNAIDSVRSWRFKPALDPDGKPVETAQTVEIQFRLF